MHNAFPLLCVDSLNVETRWTDPLWRDHRPQTTDRHTDCIHHCRAQTGETGTITAAEYWMWWDEYSGPDVEIQS